jgi:hypothetical protein
MPGLMQQRSLRHNLQVESFRLLCSDQLHCRPYFQGVARHVFVNGRRQDRPEKFRLLHGTPNPSPMRDGCLRFHRASVTRRFLEFTKVSVAMGEFRTGWRDQGLIRRQRFDAVRKWKCKSFQSQPFGMRLANSQAVIKVGRS